MARRTYKIREARERLVIDPWRKDNPFSSDMQVVHDAFFAPFVSDHARAVALGNWLQTFQPCLFGRIAAGKDWMHYCFLDDRDLCESDQDIRERITGAVLDWKRRALDAHRSQTAHGFMLCAISPDIAHASPDINLETLAKAIHDVWDCPVDDGYTKETLYLKNPHDGSCVRFTFTVDFFGAQGDKRWWHDHRVPGGIAFTANSVGHMMRVREWYSQMPRSQIEFIVQTAMLTISAAADVGYGPASWLIELSSQGPVGGGTACPFSTPPKKAELAGKDWSRYAGYHHSDQCIRSEFFRVEPDVPGALKHRPTHYQDFAYLYDPKNPEYPRFVTGEPCTQEEVDAKLAPREDWKTNIEPVAKRVVRFDLASPVVSDAELAEAQRKIEQLLDRTKEWALSPKKLAELLDEGT
jgi:hypothetical protein